MNPSPKLVTCACRVTIINRQEGRCSYVKQDLHTRLLQFKALGTHPGERGGSMVIEDDQISDSALFDLLKRLWATGV